MALELSDTENISIILWNSISYTKQDLEKGGDGDSFADVFEEQESLDKLTSIFQEMAVPRSYSDENILVVLNLILILCV